MIYHVYANRSNIGDWLSARGIQKLLPASLDITECLCDRPFIKETVRRLSGATEKDLIIIGGGGLLMDYFVPFWKAFEPIAERVPFCIWGVGCCDIKNEDSLPPRKLIENIVSKSRLCVVRDDLTRIFLENCHIPTPVQCPSINVIEPGLETGKDLLHVNNYTTVGASAYEVMREAGIKFANDSGLIYRETNNRINKDSEKELQFVLSLYEKSEFVISSALHGCIIGVVMKKKVLAVSGDKKIDAFMETFGLEDWLLETTEVDYFNKRLEDISLQASPVSIIDHVRQKNHEIAGDIVEIVNSLI